MLEYLAYCSEGSVFYTTQAENRSSRRLQTVPFPLDWQRSEDRVWEHWSPPNLRMRLQGWKIHISATIADAEQTLAIVTEICTSMQVPFKFLPTELGLQISNSKSADRSSSGKFITIYPVNDDQLNSLSVRLDQLLMGRPGPYILSDIRFRGGPVFFRYGGFLSLELRDQLDDPLYVIHKAGVLTADVREPAFSFPDDVRLPAVVAEAIAASEEEQQSPIDEYVSIDPVHFSNSGGVYRAIRIAGAPQTILKEARPNAGLDLRGRDAVERLLVEAEMLRELGDTGLVPRLLREFTAWEHHFLEMEFLPHPSLRDWTVQNFPFAKASLNDKERATFAARAVALISNLAEAVRVVHDRGYVLGDIHPDNIMVADDLSVRFIDLEDGRTIGSEEPSGFNAVGYKAPEAYSPVSADWFSVARCAVSIFEVSFTLERLAPDYWQTCLRRISIEFGEAALHSLESIETEFSHEPPARLDIQPVETVNAAEISFGLLGGTPSRVSIAAGIREARGVVTGQLYPGDITQWAENGDLNIASGAAGVSLSLSRAGLHTQAQTDAEWIDRGINGARMPLRSGLFNGLAGIAAAQHEAGLHDSARRLIEAANRAALQKRRSDLFGGLAGHALASLGLATETGSQELQESAIELASILEYRLLTHRLEWATAPLNRRAGLFYGWSGASLVFTALAHHGRSAHFRDLAEECIRLDLEQTVVSDIGIRAVQDQEGGRTLPYLAWGSAGVLLAITAFRTLPGAAGMFSAEWHSLARACTSKIYAYPNLFNGRAGVIVALAAAAQFDSALKGELEHQIQLLPHNALAWRGTVQFPGEGFFRLSTDFGTGAAGILAALTSVESYPMSWLPVVGANRLFPFPEQHITNKQKEVNTP